jgi:hypothetical protein
MKTLLFTFLFLSTGAFAQSLTVTTLKSLLTSKKAILEKVNVGMTKSTVTRSSIPVEGVDCNFTQTQVQSVIKIEGAKMIVLSKETFTPESSVACTNSGYTPYSEDVLFYQDTPVLTNDLADLDAVAADVKAITRAGEQVTMVMSTAITTETGSTVNDLVTMKYDLTKPSFKNLISISGTGYSISTTDQVDIDVSMVDLKDVLFCETSVSDKNECMRGDFSDILFE